MGVDDEVNKGGELDDGSSGEGKYEAVALAFATTNVMDSTSNRVGKSPGIKVIPRVVACVSGRPTAVMMFMDVFTMLVIEVSLGSAVRVKFTVALDRGDG